MANLTCKSDEEIMTVMIDDDLSGMEELFKRYHFRLYNYAYHILSSRQQSEDVVQDTFIKIINYRKSFKDDKGTFKSWMYQIARNTLNDQIKRNQRERITEIDEMKMRVLQTNEISEPFSQFPDLFTILNRLSDCDKEIIILSRIENFKYTEISNITGKSVSEIKIRVHRAIKNLRSAFAKK